MSVSVDVVQSWARAALSVGDSATHAERRAAVLRFVRGAEFAPAPDEAAAIGIALGRAKDPIDVFTHEACYTREEDALGREIDAFGRGFFDMPHTQRSQRWRELHVRSAAFPWWQDRLAHLQTGLDIDKPTTESRLAEMALELFSLPAAERAGRRRELVASFRSNPVPPHEINAFQQAHPRIAKLAGDLLDDLVFRPQTRNVSPRRAGREVGNVSYGPARTPQPAASNLSGGRGWSLGAVGIFVVIGIRLLAGGVSATRHEAPINVRPAFNLNDAKFFPRVQDPGEFPGGGQGFQGGGFQGGGFQGGNVDPEMKKMIKDIVDRHNRGENPPMGKATRILLGLDDKDNNKK